MNKLLELCERRRAEALREAQAIFDATKAETRETTDEEEARVDALMAEAKELEIAVDEYLKICLKKREILRNHRREEKMNRLRPFPGCQFGRK